MLSLLVKRLCHQLWSHSNQGAGLVSLVDGVEEEGFRVIAIAHDILG